MERHSLLWHIDNAIAQWVLELIESKGDRSERRSKAGQHKG